MERLEPFSAKQNGDKPRWVIYPQRNGEHGIVGPFKKKTASMIAEDTGGIVYMEQPDLSDESLVELKYAGNEGQTGGGDS